MSGTLWQRTTYLIDTNFILSQYIYEYDIRKANINILHSLGILDDEYYNRLNNMDRNDRQVEIGYLLKHNEGLYEKLADGIKYYRQQFFEQNMLEDYEILSIKNDAIFVLGKKCKITKFGEIEFVLKNTYTSYMKLPNQIEIYYSRAPFADVDGNWNVDCSVKGISDEVLKRHQGGFLDIILLFISYMELGNTQDALDFIAEMTQLFIARKIKLNVLRNFDAMSYYTIIVRGERYGVPEITSQEHAKLIDIKVNLDILRFMYGLAAERTITS